MSRRVLNKIAASLPLALAIALGASSLPRAVAQTAPKAKAKTEKSAVKTPLDLNTATAEEMVEVLPGVGEATAKKIIAGRPYAAVDDLAKAGVPARTIAALRDHATVSTSAPTTPSASTPAKTAAKTATKPAARATAARPVPGKPVNINTASREELDALPGIGPVKSHAIIDSRPFKTKEDVMKVKGIKEGEFSKIKNLITVD